MADVTQLCAAMSSGGFGWISDLTVADPFYILPLAMVLFNLSNLEVLHYFTHISSVWLIFVLVCLSSKLGDFNDQKNF